jgi:hypothetical protein
MFVFLGMPEGGETALPACFFNYLRVALDCCETRRAVIEVTGIGEIIGDKVYYELFQERMIYQYYDETETP